MKKFNLFSNKALAALLLLIPICLVLTNCKNAGKKSIKSQAIDSVYFAGKLKLTDTAINHTFYIKSIGNADLSIDSVAASCSCVNISWQKTPIKPGQKGFINVTVKPSLKSKGKLMQYVMVRTNSTTPLSVYQIFFIK
ncbi:MAG: DUF1573 domain-containing protein [Bacteroidota bacterium]